MLTLCVEHFSVARITSAAEGHLLGLTLVCSSQGLSFHLGAVLLSLGFITYVEHGREAALRRLLPDQLSGMVV